MLNCVNYSGADVLGCCRRSRSEHERSIFVTDLSKRHRLSLLAPGPLLQHADSCGGVLLPRWALGLQLRPVPHTGAPRHCAPVPELPVARWPIATVPLIDLRRISLVSPLLVPLASYLCAELCIYQPEMTGVGDTAVSHCYLCSERRCVSREA